MIRKGAARLLLAIGVASAQAGAEEPPGERAEPSSAERAASPDATRARLPRIVGVAGGLTADDVARRAATTSPDARASAAGVSRAEAEMAGAEVAYYPRLTLTGRYTRLSPIEQPSLGPEGANLVVTQTGAGPIPPGTTLVGVPGSALSFPVILDQYLLQANVTIPVSDYLLRTSQRYAATSHSKRAAELSEQAARRAAALRGRLTYYSWVRARLQTVAAEQALDQARAHLRLAKAGQDVGRVPAVDVMRAESQVASAELLVQRARQLVSLADTELRVVMHDESGAVYRIGENPLRPLGDGSDERFAALYAEALAARPELRALDESALSLEDQRTAEAANAYPRLDAFGNAYYANPNQRYIPQREQWNASWDVGLQVTWSPNDLGTSRSTSRALEARRAEVEAQKAGLLDELRREVARAHQDLQTARLAADTAQRALAASEEAYRGRLALFEEGRATTVELIDAETDLLRARLELIDAHVDGREARARLRHAVGRDAVK